MNRLPIVGSYYGRLAISSWLLKLADRTRFIAFRRFDSILANSKAQRSELIEFRIPENRIELLPSCVDTNELQPPTTPEVDAARRRLDIPPGCLVLSTIARLSRNKGHTYMLQALSRLRDEMPELIYLIPGEGDLAWRGEGGLRAELEGEAKSLGISDRVRFLGYYPDLKTILHATDIVVSPSLLEGMQVALLEAMSAGRPIIATAIGGTPDAVVDCETGFLVPPADSLALADAILRLVKDPVKMEQMGEAGRHRVKELFDSAIVARQLLRTAERHAS
jgi:glycosyltransferase involved in cell wall biosynthesis